MTDPNHYFMNCTLNQCNNDWDNKMNYFTDCKHKQYAVYCLNSIITSCSPKYSTGSNLQLYVQWRGFHKSWFPIDKLAQSKYPVWHAETANNNLTKTKTINKTWARTISITCHGIIKYKYGSHFINVGLMWLFVLNMIVETLWQKVMRWMILVHQLQLYFQYKV